jgi:hypothetical protein
MKGSYQMKNMKKVCAVLCAVLSVLLIASAFAGPNDVHWNRIEGVITALNVDNPVGNNIHSGTFAWSVGSGHAQVNLSNGHTSFQVEGLVIDGTAFSGTPGPITMVEGTLVCNAGTPAETPFDTPSVPLDAQGDAHFTGQLGSIPTACGNPIFLIRIANPFAAGRWIATGADRTGGQ